MIDAVVHEATLTDERRVDGRKLDEIRPLEAHAGGFPDILHGTGLFYRGETHVLSVLTLGSPEDSQTIEGMEIRTKKYFMHHYNFPPFSTGEIGRSGNTNRRSIGHGALAEKALLPVIPSVEEFPYTVRLVSESLASNGSTSMASVCAGTLALMDGGVPIKKPVAGISMGLMMGKRSGKLVYKILTDIQGPEDHHGDMDFKVAGTKDGITAIQMDVKVDGVPVGILTESLEKAREARLKILNCIAEAINEPRKTLKPSAPNIEMVSIPLEKIGLVIGSGGRTIKKLIEDTGAEINVDDTGKVYIAGTKEAVERAKNAVVALTKEWKRGEEAEGTVVKILDFGAFVELGPNAEGLVHISELAASRIDNIHDVLCIGEKVPVVVKEIDDLGRINLSIARRDLNFIKPGEKKNCATFPTGNKVSYNNGNGRSRGPKGGNHRR